MNANNEFDAVLQKNEAGKFDVLDVDGESLFEAATLEACAEWCFDNDYSYTVAK